MNSERSFDDLIGRRKSIPANSVREPDAKQAARGRSVVAPSNLPTRQTRTGVRSPTASIGPVRRE